MLTPAGPWLEPSWGGSGVLSVEDWAEIRRLHRAERMPIKQVARVMGCSRNTVKRALAADGPPRYQRMPQGSIVDAVEPRIRELLAAWPTMPATVIAERIGWTRGVTVLKERGRELRPGYFPPDPASRTAYSAGGGEGEGAVGRGGRQQTILPEAAPGFGGVGGPKILICNPADPEAKGLVE